MAPSASSIQFIKTALLCNTPFALSYTDSDQKWIIRDHLRSFLKDFPSFGPSCDPFFHNDGTTVNLLKVSGSLHVSRSVPSIPIIIWLHEKYPIEAPMVFVSSTAPIHRNHPFVDSSGVTTPPYILTWIYPRSNLSDLVHNLINLFSYDHPFFHSPGSGFTHPSFVSKMEALDRLVGMLYYDVVAVRTSTEEEIEKLLVLWGALENRSHITGMMIEGLEREKSSLKERVEGLTEAADVLANWLRVHDPESTVAMAGEDAFKAADKESEAMLESEAADLAMQDLLYDLDKAVEEGAISFDSYIRQVRSLCREQYFHRDLGLKLQGMDILSMLKGV